jgi:uncharacterized damage-inducible protein DinB
MAIADSLLPEFDHEMKTTRTVLARVPDDRAAWKPHTKSASLGDLAIHVATLNRWAVASLSDTTFDVNPKGGERWSPPTWESRTATLAAFDEGRDEARRAIAGASDADLMVPWTLRAGDRVILTLPRIAVLRSFVLSHLIHHRGQLSVYLRLNDIPVPPIYGPTADES